MKQLLHSKAHKMWGAICLFLLLLVAFVASICLGQISIKFSSVVNAFLHYDETITEHIIIRTTRVSRTVIAVLIGASLGVAGAYMQALTRNPLASPSIFGINAGAMFFIVLAISIFSISSIVAYMWIAFLGASISAILVYFLGSLGREGLSPFKMVLAGSAVTALFSSFTQGMLVINEDNLESILFWLGGSVSVRTLESIQPIIPFVMLALLLAVFIARPVNIMSSGDDIARNLGQKLGLVKASLAIIIVVLAGGSVAMGGSIAFIGLIVPHIARILVGHDYRWIIPYCLLIGACLLLLSDIIARLIIMPQELPIGVMTAFIGTPIFIFIARRGFFKNEKAS